MYYENFKQAIEFHTAGYVNREWLVNAWAVEQFKQGIKPKVLNGSGTAWVEAV